MEHKNPRNLVSKSLKVGEGCLGWRLAWRLETPYRSRHCTSAVNLKIRRFFRQPGAYDIFLLFRSSLGDRGFPSSTRFFPPTPFFGYTNDQNLENKYTFSPIFPLFFFFPHIFPFSLKFYRGGTCPEAPLGNR